ncbi:MAG: outer membrane protein assembly factor BamD [Bacteroidota bacterium]
MKRILFLGLLAALAACSDYNEVLKGDDYALKFSTANTLYQTESKRAYEKAIVLFEQVFQHAPKSKEGETSYFLMAKSYYEKQDYYMAGYYFGSFVQRYPYSMRHEEAFFLTAMCSVNNSPKWSLDQTETYEAINAVQQFVDKYPSSPLIDSCNKIIDELSYKLEYKDYNKVLLYDKTGNYKAAVSYADLFMEKFPLSIHEEEVRSCAIKNGFYLAENSIESKKKERIEETLQRYRTFVDDFPTSSYLASLKVLLKPWEKDYEF